MITLRLRTVNGDIINVSPVQATSGACSTKEYDYNCINNPMTLIRSKQRVADHGEVFTPPWMVEAMLNLVEGETERIDARFLEPVTFVGFIGILFIIDYVTYHI